MNKDLEPIELNVPSEPALAVLTLTLKDGSGAGAAPQLHDVSGYRRTGGSR